MMQARQAACGSKTQANDHASQAAGCFVEKPEPRGHVWAKQQRVTTSKFLLLHVGLVTDVPWGRALVRLLYASCARACMLVIPN
eukprot:11154850-Lingulodinium_polyedra.AAC.1